MTQAIWYPVPQQIMFTKSLSNPHSLNSTRSIPTATLNLKLLGRAVLLSSLEANLGAAEAAIGLAIIVVYFRNSGTIRVEEIDKLKG